MPIARFDDITGGGLPLRRTTLFMGGLGSRLLEWRASRTACSSNIVEVPFMIGPTGYYAWPSYWGVARMCGMGGFPVAPPHLVPISDEHQGGGSANTDDPHLHSTQAIRGYDIQTRDGTIGHVSDFKIDDKSWALRHLVVETGHWFSGKEFVVAPGKIERISFERSEVFVSVRKQSIENATEYANCRHSARPDPRRHSILYDELTHE